MSQSQVRERTIRLFEFLKAVRALREAPVRDFRQFGDQAWWQDELPLHAGCSLRALAEEDGAWLTVRQQAAAAAPTDPADPAWRVQQLYSDLFLLRQRLQKEGDSIELVWGHGLLSWQVQEEQIYHPLLLTRMEIEFDPVSGVLRLVPGSSPTFVELEPLDGLDVDGISAVTAIAAELTANPIDPWDAEACRKLYKEVVNSLSPAGATTGDGRPPVPGAHPAMGHAPVLFVRRRRTGYQRDLQKIAEAVRTGHPIPATVASVVAYDQTPDEADDWSRTAEQLLLPLPSNVEQVEIARRLAGAHGVTVQGPPGTGKSHTIANLISHLLAHGKRVLVTSHAERPLQVLRDRIPEPIRPLCVSLLGADADALKLLEQSVQTMAEKLGALDLETAAREIARLTEELTQAREEITGARDRLQFAIAREQLPYRLGDRELKPADLGAWLHEHEAELGFIPDRVTPDATLPLTAAEIARLYQLAGTLPPADVVKLSAARPDPAELPGGPDLRRMMDRLAELGELLAVAPVALRQWMPPRAASPEKLADLTRALEQAREQVERLQEPWLAAIRQDAARGGMRRRQWEELLVEVKNRSEQIMTLQRQVAAHQLTLPEAQPLPEVLQSLQELKAHLAGGGGLGALSLLFKGNLKSLVGQVAVDGAPVRTVADVEVLMAEVKLRQERLALVNLWNRMTVAIGGPQADPQAGRPEVLVDEGAREIQGALSWEFEVWHPLAAEIKGLGLTAADEATVATLTAARETIQMARLRREQHDLEAELFEAKTVVAGEAESAPEAPLWQQLFQAMEAADWDAWEGALAEARRLQALEAPARELRDLRGRLAEAAPLWAERLPGAPDRAVEAWAWRQADTWLKDLLAEDPNVLQRELDALLERERTLVTALVAASTWRAQAERVTDGQRRALIGWQQLIQRIGKGTGKYAPRLKREAQLRMQECREAVPVWIMPMQRVVENFDPLGEPFDVVIVDESSQCDSFALLALFRARRAVIVGDDNQISPQGVGVDEEQVNRLIDQYLEAVPNRELFGPRQSLYDIATRAFPGVILLREHFRCLPEIIQFSNQLMYEGRILPLREPGANPSWQPVIARRVPEGQRDGDLNLAEADALVEAVVTCCQAPAYKGKSMGVISLLGEAQARLIEQKLLARLGPAEIDRRGLLCGDAYYFQGDERDLIFLSMVESGGPHRKAVLNKLADRQRFNVAASRARDQLWLFYSIDPAELNTEDVRSRLIRYCEAPPTEERANRDPADLCETDFQRAVLHELLTRGYSVRPQVKVGHFAIDLVVEGAKARLAIECDSVRLTGAAELEADLQRQLTLERKGWKFFRVRGSAYSRDREAALAPLWERLAHMGVQPAKAK